MVYLADLGSLNGTRSTDNRGYGAGEPAARRRICFAGLCYQIEILGAAARQASQRSRQRRSLLVLKPQDPKARSSRSSSTSFPFLVNKRSEVFARYGERWPTSSSTCRAAMRTSSCERQPVYRGSRQHQRHLRRRRTPRRTRPPARQRRRGRLRRRLFRLSRGTGIRDTEAPQQRLDATHVATTSGHRGRHSDDLRHLGQLVPGHLLRRRRQRR